MRLFGITVAIILNSLFAGAVMAAENIENNALWYQCRTEDNCMVGEGVCANPVGINKAYKDAFDDYIGKMYPAVSCAPPTAEGIAYKKRVIAKCVSGRCLLVDPLGKHPDIP